MKLQTLTLTIKSSFLLESQKVILSSSVCLIIILGSDFNYFKLIPQAQAQTQRLLTPRTDGNSLSSQIYISSWALTNSDETPGVFIKNISTSPPSSYPEDILVKDNNTVFVIYQNVLGVMFTCEASFPIQWVRVKEDEIVI